MPEPSMHGQGFNQISRLDTIGGLMPDWAKKPLAVICAAGAIATPSTLIEVAPAIGQEAPLTDTNPRLTAPNDNLDVMRCQDAIVGTAEKPSTDYTTGSFVYKMGSKIVNAKLKTKNAIINRGSDEVQSLLDCDKVTNNYTVLQLVQRTGSSKKSGTASSTSKIGKETRVSGNTNADLNAGISKMSKTLKLSKKLDKKTVNKRNIGVQLTTISEPKIQRPYIDEQNPANSIPGPMQARSATNTVWISRNQVAAKPLDFDYRLYKPGTKSALNRALAWDNASSAYFMVDPVSHRQRTNAAGKMTVREVTVDGEKYNKYVVRSKRQLLGALALTQKNYMYFPKFRHDKKKNTYSYTDVNQDSGKSVNIMTTYMR